MSVVVVSWLLPYVLSVVCWPVSVDCCVICVSFDEVVVVGCCCLCCLSVVDGCCVLGLDCC